LKVRTDKDLSKPIHMMPGDVFQLVYQPPSRWLGRAMKGEQVLLEQKIEKEMTVNYVAALDLERKELRQLGLTEALVGLFGHKEK